MRRGGGFKFIIWRQAKKGGRPTFVGGGDPLVTMTYLITTNLIT